MSAKVYYSVCLALVMLASLTSCNGEKTKEDKVPTVRLDTVRIADVEATLQFPGRVVSSQDANVSFKVAGTIRRVLVNEGDFVKEGQLLAEMDDTDYKVQLSATEAEYARVKAEAERVMALYGDGATTASNYDKARYGLTQMEAKLKNHRDQLAYCKIYAPFTGHVQTRYFKSGETVAAGMPIVNVLGSKAPEIEINLPASSYLQRDNFTSFSATFDMLPGEVLPLRYLSVIPKANANQLYTVRLQLTDDTKGIAPGMSAWVTIVSADKDGEALVRVATTSVVREKGYSFVYLYNGKTQEVRRSNVEITALHTDGTCTVSGSIKPGDIIVCTGANHIKTGDKVEVLEPISKTNVGGLL